MNSKKLDSNELELLQQLSHPTSLHALVCNSLISTVSKDVQEFTDGMPYRSTLLEPKVQAYLKMLLQRCSSSKELREQVISPLSLAYLECLTAESTREQLIQVISGEDFLDSTHIP